MASDFGKVVPYATHFVNGGRRYYRQLQRLVLDYRRLQGQGIGA